MLYASKRLQNTKRFKEYESLRDKYYKVSLEKEAKQKSFLKSANISNLDTGEVLNSYYSFEKYYKKYTKSIEQKAYAIEMLSREQGLVPVFITITLPSKFHPFSSISYGKGKRLYTNLNDNFDF